MPNKGDLRVIENVQRKALAWILGPNVLTYKKLVTLDILPLCADRENGTHGGVVILCKSHVHYETISLSCDYACAIKICLSDVVIFIICIYNPPKGSPFRVNWNIIIIKRLYS